MEKKNFLFLFAVLTFVTFSSELLKSDVVCASELLCSTSAIYKMRNFLITHTNLHSDILTFSRTNSRVYAGTYDIIKTCHLWRSMTVIIAPGCHGNSYAHLTTLFHIKTYNYDSACSAMTYFVFALITNLFAPFSLS